MGTSRTIDVTSEQKKIISDLLQKHLPDVMVWAYGSRIKGTASAQSDLDLVAFTTPAQKKHVFDLKEAFEESDLSFRVDLFIWDEIPENFRDAIQAEHLILTEA
jgi:predicted nucleotidyltransferase